MSLKGTDFLSLADFNKNEIQKILKKAKEIKKEQKKGVYKKPLLNKTVALIFEKPSTRTRVSFEAGILKLGAYPLYLESSTLQLMRGETIEDTGKVLSRYVDAIAVRTFSQKMLEKLAEAAEVPVINALTDYSHPCQGLGDFLTIDEKKGDFKKLKLAYLGDGNNVCHSLIFGASILGLDIYLACPKPYQPDKSVMQKAKDFAKKNKSIINLSEKIEEVVTNADIIYTDVWASMGKESEIKERKKIFQPYQVNTKLISKAKKDVIVMHCLPAHRGEEITDDVLDGSYSIVLDQAENRLYVQEALLSLII